MLVRVKRTHMQCHDGLTMASLVYFYLQLLGHSLEDICGIIYIISDGMSDTLSSFMSDVKYDVIQMSCPIYFRV